MVLHLLPDQLFFLFLDFFWKGNEVLFILFNVLLKQAHVRVKTLSATPVGQYVVFRFNISIVHWTKLIIKLGELGPKLVAEIGGGVLVVPVVAPEGEVFEVLKLHANVVGRY